METTTLGAGASHPEAFGKFHPPSIKFAKRAARRLQRACYLQAGHSVALSEAQETLARAYGHKDWYAMAKAIEQKGYACSNLDHDLTSAELRIRHDFIDRVISSRLDIPFAYKVRAAARVTAQPVEPQAPTPGEKEPPVAQPLPVARRRAGLREIYLTAIPITVGYKDLPLPGWQDYVVVASPLDNTALWVRFCDERDVSREMRFLVGNIKALSEGSLAVAYVPSHMQALVPQLSALLEGIGVQHAGGRPAIMAARLRERLHQVLAYTAMELREWEDQPSLAEMSGLFNLDEGLIEIPDIKNVPLGETDLRHIKFGQLLAHEIRERRWASACEPPATPKPPIAARRTEFWSDDDGKVRFGSAVRRVAKGVPVYRIRIDLPLEDDETGRRVIVTRTIDVPPRYDLWDLHVAIQSAMGWADYHMHEFTFYEGSSGKKHVSFGCPDPQNPTAPMTANEDLAKHIAALSRWPATYLYDFGDNWRHELTLVGTFPSDGGGYPRCIGGDRACPPEDCGSDPGYFRLIDELARASSSPGKRAVRQELREWLEGSHNATWPYHPEHFDIASVWFDDPQERWDYAYAMDVKKDAD